jgi:CubicO group peptidase (beta-lactamase class C family)
VSRSSWGALDIASRTLLHTAESLRGRVKTGRRAAVALVAIGAVAVATLVVADQHERRAFRAPESVDALVAQLDRIVPDALAEGRVPGAAVAVVHDGRVAWSGGYGVADARTRRPVTGSTRFQVGSLSKPVTAWAAFELARRGGLGLDSPLVDVLDRWPLPPSDQDERAVTARRLLSHTAGMSVDGYLGVDPGRRPGSTLASLQGTGSAGERTGVALMDRPGAGYRYSGGGYTLLQYAIEQSTGRPFAAWADDTVLEPLGMRHSAFAWPPRSGAPAAAGHDAGGRSLPGYRYAELAAAGLTSTASDMGRFAAALVRDPDRLGRPEPATSGHYGLGVELHRLDDGTTVVWHEGVNRGWHARLLAYPDRDWAVVTLTNGDAGGTVADAVQRLFED